MFQGNSVTYSKSKNSSLITKNLNYGKKRFILNKTRVINSKSERIVLMKNPTKISKSTCTDNIQTPARRETYLIENEDKENLSDLKANLVVQENIFTSSTQRFRLGNNDFNNHINMKNENFNYSFDSLDEPLGKTVNHYFPCLTPLKNTENLISPFSTTSKSNSLNKTNKDLASISFNTSVFKPNQELVSFITPDNKSLNIEKTQEWVNRRPMLNHTSNVLS